MNASRTVLLRGTGKAAVAALLMVLLFLSALATASPLLHKSLHHDHNSPSHYCLVSLLDHGHGAAPMAVTFVHVTDFVCAASHVGDAQSIPTPDRTLHSGRGPPCLA